ncbi:putative pentatricopeptide repeat-containing protein At5g40405 [Wolffia australiana]
MRAPTIRAISAVPCPFSLLDPSTGLQELRQIHAQLLVNDHLADSRKLGKFAAAVALSRHYKPSSTPPIDYAELIISHSPAQPNVFSLNSLIRAHSKGPTPLRGFLFFRQILHSSGNLLPDNYTFTFLVRCCVGLPSNSGGAAVHAAALRRGFAGDSHVQSGLIHVYAELGLLDCCRRVYGEMGQPDLVSQTAMVAATARCGEIELAREMFDEMPTRDSVAWNAMIAGFEQLGRPREALKVFLQMQTEGSAEINEATVVSVLAACGQIGALGCGRWAHHYVSKARLRMTVALGTALVDMYAKCGDMGRAMEVFDEMPERNVTTWSAAINGLALNGAGEDCLALFRRMEEEGPRPNEITFLALLRGCSSAGMVEQGLGIFDRMRGYYQVQPWQEHYGCLVDLYGRAGRLDEAAAVIESMPSEPHIGAWSALLSSCRTHNNKELGELAAFKITELEAKNDGAYVQLYNIYAGSGNWAAAGGVRDMMRTRGVSKEPGCSAVEISGKLHEFFSGDRSHSRQAELEAMAEEVARRLRAVGYVPATSLVMFDLEEEEKEDALARHSERIAIAFALLNSPEGEIIRVVKNLRVCIDCHEASKLISLVFRRDIIVRDRSRFHHYKDGKCSCRDYW